MAKMDSYSDGKRENNRSKYIWTPNIYLPLYLGYNDKLKAIAANYTATEGGDFAVVYTPAPIDILSFPIDALRFERF
jgi:hypothetical protein